MRLRSGAAVAGVVAERAGAGIVRIDTDGAHRRPDCRLDRRRGLADQGSPPVRTA